MQRQCALENPYRPGAGHLPPFLAGRVDEIRFFKRAIHHCPITENILITGLRGVGKTVLLRHMRQIAEQNDWLWVGNDLSESSALSEDRLALRILTDLSQAITRRAEQGRRQDEAEGDGFKQRLDRIEQSGGGSFAFEALREQYESAPGLPSDRLKSVLLMVTNLVRRAKLAGIMLAYDEAQCLADRSAINEFPMSMLIETVGTLQQGEGQSPCLLVLSGLPHVFEALTETRTYTERMFHVMTLDRLSREDTRSALVTPLNELMPPLRVSEDLLSKVVDFTGGYPYLIQFFGRELVEQLLQNGGSLAVSQFPSAASLDDLDAGLFGARWNKTSERQREFLGLIARRANNRSPDFSAADILQSADAQSEFGPATANQMLLALVDRGLIYRTRHGRYAFTVPMSELMIMRRLARENEARNDWQTARESGAIPSADVIDRQQSTKKSAKRRGWFR